VLKYTKVSSPLYLLMLAGWSLLTSCSPENNGFVGRIFHNTTSHYNAYFLSQERLGETEAKMFKDRKDDYTRLLDVMIPLDSVKAGAYKADMEYIIKKSSIGIQFHKYSTWTDDHYLLIGKARLYQLDYQNALETFKYVNVQSPSESSRHKSMLGLMQIFIWQKDYEKARAAIGYIRKEKLNKTNTADFYLARGQLYKELEDYAKTAAALKLALPLMKRGEKKSRTYFVAGQLNEMLGKNNQAYKFYRSALKYNPSFELDFNARLNLIEMYQVKREKDNKKLLRLFGKMLREEKNKDFKDQIYYQMGMFEFRQKHFDKALAFFRQSTAAGLQNKTQKALAYLKAGEINYDNLQKYEQAAVYYDSTMQFLPKDFKNYNAIAKRQKILKNFATQVTTIRTEDSLQQLGMLDEIALNELIDRKIDKEELAKVKAEKASREREAQAANDDPFANRQDLQQSGSRNYQAPPPGQTGSGQWYFYNTAALSQGQNEFTRKWGRRPNEDNWRRSGRGIQASETIVQTPETKPDTSNINAIAKQTGEQKKKQAAENQRKNRRLELLSAIPRTDDQKRTSNNKVEKATYQLGKIYDLDLDEDTNAIATFEKLMKRFPDNEHGAEVLYNLFLLYKNQGNEAGMTLARERLQSRFAETDFAKLADNPNYIQEGNVNDKQVEQLYGNAYELYLAAQYEQASGQIQSALQQYPDTRLKEQFRLLQIFIIAKTQEVPNYRLALKQFATDFPKSKNLAYIQSLLQASEKFETRQPEKLQPKK
jgi:tetratricopeptide (TPR) repeat protein